MQYSYWSGEVQGLEEKAMWNFSKQPTFTNALSTLIFCIKIRADFLYYKQKGMIDGKLTPFNTNLVRNIFVGAKNSLRK
jgi:hypothetical protein